MAHVLKHTAAKLNLAEHDVGPDLPFVKLDVLCRFQWCDCPNRAKVVVFQWKMDTHGQQLTLLAVLKSVVILFWNKKASANCKPSRVLVHPYYI